MPQPHASGHFRTDYANDWRLLQTRGQRASAFAGVVLACWFPFLASPFQLDLANQVLIAVVGAVALMLLTGYAGQVSLGHAGLMAAGAFTTGIPMTAKVEGKYPTKFPQSRDHFFHMVLLAVPREAVGQNNP